MYDGTKIDMNSVIIRVFGDDDDGNNIGTPYMAVCLLNNKQPIFNIKYYSEMFHHYHSHLSCVYTSTWSFNTTTTTTTTKIYQIVHINVYTRYMLQLDIFNDIHSGQQQLV